MSEEQKGSNKDLVKIVGANFARPRIGGNIDHERTAGTGQAFNIGNASQEVVVEAGSKIKTNALYLADGASGAIVRLSKFVETPVDVNTLNITIENGGLNIVAIAKIIV